MTLRRSLWSGTRASVQFYRHHSGDSPTVCEEGTRSYFTKQLQYLSDSGVQSVYLYIALDADTAAFIKYYGIGTGNFSSWLSFSDTFVSDNMDTFAEPKWDGSIYGYTPLSPNVYTADTRGPTVNSWLLDQVFDNLILKFDEPVTINASQIFISSGIFQRVVQCIPG